MHLHIKARPLPIRIASLLMWNSYYSSTSNEIYRRDFKTQYKNIILHINNINLRQIFYFSNVKGYFKI